MMKWLPCGLLLAYGLIGTTFLQAESAPDQLPGTGKLEITVPLDEVMVEGINRFALNEIKKACQNRTDNWPVDISSPEAYEKSLKPLREEFKELIGVVEERVKNPQIELVSTIQQSSLIGESSQFEIHQVRWQVLKGVTAEGLLLQPKKQHAGNVVVLPDADTTPEELCGLVAGQKTEKSVPLLFASMGYRVLVPMLINRQQTYSGYPDVFFTNQPHREFIYRMGFELGRHIIGYEVQKVLAAVDALEQLDKQKPQPIFVTGDGEGGLLALYSGAIDTRIEGVGCSGYFNRREKLWQEPIYRNVWGLLTKFGDAQLAGMIAPRHLVITADSPFPEVAGPPQPLKGRKNSAAPGTLSAKPVKQTLLKEAELAKTYFEKSGSLSGLHISTDPSPAGVLLLVALAIGNDVGILGFPVTYDMQQLTIHRSPSEKELEARQQQQFEELVDYTQGLLAVSHKTRDWKWNSADRSTPEKWVASTKELKKWAEEEFIGVIDLPMLPPNARTRKILETSEYTGYEVMLDVFEDVIAGGILLLPTNMKPEDKRPVVVCQHGLEGTSMSCISEAPEYKRYYESFAAELARRGFITYSPQNPYRGKDKFRSIQRKSNLLKRSLFSYIIPQHRQTLRWMATLPNVDAERIAFYGLSYGGKTAVRVPPFVEEYCLSICSGDFNEWIYKNTTNKERYSYLFHGEYEIFEWNMGHVANYAELANLMAPRPFMVERGHNDGVAPDRWVAAEYAKVRRHYVQMGLGDKTEIEFFNGPHKINAVGTFKFLHKHLNWPEN